jgi:hypothetical protein
MAEGFALPFQLLAPIVVMNDAGSLRGNTGSIIIIIVIPDDLVI